MFRAARCGFRRRSIVTGVAADRVEYHRLKVIVQPARTILTRCSETLTGMTTV